MIHKHREHDAPERRPAWRYGSILVLAGLLAAGAIRSAHGEALPRGGRVVIEDQCLSVTLAEAPLPDVLVALAQAAPFKISVKGAVEATPVSLTLHNVALEEGLRRLLQHASYAIVSAPASAMHLAPRQSRIVELIVLGSGEAATRPEAGGVWPRTPAPGTALGRAEARAATPQAVAPEPISGSADELGQTLRRLARQPSPEGQTTLAAALDEPEKEVRATALQILWDQSTAVPVERLTRLAREDSSAHLRLEALTLLAERAPEAAWEALKAARHDAEPGIRERAERLLDELDAFATQRSHTPDP